VPIFCVEVVLNGRRGYLFEYSDVIHQPNILVTQKCSTDLEGRSYYESLGIGGKYSDVSHEPVFSSSSYCPLSITVRLKGTYFTFMLGT
jgi:hypothetical protein